MRLYDAPKFLTHIELGAELSHFTYKPGWALRLFLDPWEGSVLRIVADLPDAYHPSKIVPIRVNSRVPPMADVTQFDHYLLWRVSQIESHEAREWLRRDGKPLYDPHDPVEPP